MFKRKSKNKIKPDIIFTHNCSSRILCGRVEQTASMMALGSTLGTTVDGTHKGAGITKMQGQISRVQYYFAPQSWIDQTYFKQRGLDSLGYQSDDTTNIEDIELSGDIELDDTNSSVVFEFDDQRVEIDNRHNQRFEEI